MTTIASDGRTVAADGRRCIGNEIVCDNYRKLVVMEGRVFGITGGLAGGEAGIRWVLAGADPAEVPKTDPQYSWTVIEFKVEHCVSWRSSDPYPETTPYPVTFGSGCDYAMAVLDLGFSPPDAVKAAARRNVHTGGEIQVIDIASALGLMQQAAE